MGLSQRCTLRCIQRCIHCGCSEGHDENCPLGQLENLRDYELKSSRIAKCPECSGSASVNQTDYYECRSCHMQYCTGRHRGVGPVLLLDVLGQGMVQARALTEKGTGNFPLDKRIQELEAVVDKARKEYLQKTGETEESDFSNEENDEE